MSIENQEWADRRFPAICELAEAGWRTFVSMEPLLGLVRIPDRYLQLGDRAGVILGGESGHDPRACHINWIEQPLKQCQAAGVRVFVKQLGANVEACDLIDAADYFPGPVRWSDAPRPMPASTSATPRAAIPPSGPSISRYGRSSSNGRIHRRRRSGRKRSTWPSSTCFWTPRRKYGLVTGGAEVNLRCCEQILKEGRRRGYRPSKEGVDRCIQAAIGG